MHPIQKHVEALIFAAETGISKQELLDILRSKVEEAPSPEAAEMESDALATELDQMLDCIADEYSKETSVFELRYLNNAYQFLTKSEYHPTIMQLQSHRSKRKLSQAALETLAIIAYRQPITKLEIEHIRGVNCDYTIQRLLEKELISIVGKADAVGRPLLYGSSPQLLDYFGLNDLTELPKLKEITAPENTIGEQAD